MERYPFWLPTNSLRIELWMPLHRPVFLWVEEGDRIVREPSYEATTHSLVFFCYKVAF